ncbi:hypothetical protein [Hyalangium gracile]|uniref:hypothetical protein n=1 Tax=Hyalangium gracile TaxID=394092 RepID=UPI001CC92F14|nr:hypothetical protein [Hyalangium gracile]
MISDVKDTQQTQATGGSDPVSSAADEARRAAEAAAEAARKAAEAAAQAAQARDAQKAQELQAKAAKFAEDAAKAARNAVAAAERAAAAVQKAVGKGKPTARQTELLKKAKASAGAATGSSLAAAASTAKAATAVKKLQPRKPTDTFVIASGPPTPFGPSLDLKSKQPQPTKNPEPPKPLTPQDKLEAARERRLQETERSSPVNALPAVPSGPEAVGVDATGKAPIPSRLEKLERVKDVKQKYDPNIQLTLTSQYSSDVSEKTQAGSMAQLAIFQVSHEMGASLSVGGKAGAVSGKVSQTESKALRYTFSLPADQAKAYQSEGRVPDITDPRSLPVGSTALINEEELRGSAIELNLEVMKIEGENEMSSSPLNFGKPSFSGGPRLEAGSSDIAGRSTLVERLPDNQVRLTSGPTEGVKHQMAAGLYFGDGLGLVEAGGKLGNTRSLTGGEYKSVTVDLNQPSGKAVYQHFLATGQVPPASGNVVKDQTTVYESHYATSVEAEAGIKALGLSWKAGGTLAEYGVDQRLTVKGDGTSTSLATVRNSNRTLQLEKGFDAQGEPVAGSLKTHYLVSQTEAETARVLQDSFTPKGELVEPAAGTQDAQLSLTEQDAMALRQIARDYCDNATGRPEVWKEGGDREVPPMVIALANSETPEDVNYALVDTGANNNNLYDLYKLREFNNAPLPGTVEVRANP